MDAFSLPGICHEWLELSWLEYAFVSELGKITGSRSLILSILQIGWDQDALLNLFLFLYVLSVSGFGPSIFTTAISYLFL